MCTGVIDITPTITTCPTATAQTPRRAPTLPLIAASADPQDAGFCEASGTGARLRAVSSGSGRSSTNSASAPSPNATALNRYGPAYSGAPHGIVTLSVNGARFGPITAPSVVAQTTSDRCRARRSP